MAHDLASPALAGVLLLVLSYDALFTGATLGFLVSATPLWLYRAPTSGRVS